MLTANRSIAAEFKEVQLNGIFENLFAKFKKCTEIYCALWEAGSGIEQLAVAV